MTRSTSTSRTSNRTLQSLSDCSAVRRERIANLVEKLPPRALTMVRSQKSGNNS